MSFGFKVILPASGSDLPGGKARAEGPVERTTRISASAAEAVDARMKARARCRARMLF
jgi:hypothetical protein